MEILSNINYWLSKELKEEQILVEYLQFFKGSKFIKKELDLI